MSEDLMINQHANRDSETHMKKRCTDLRAAMRMMVSRLAGLAKKPHQANGQEEQEEKGCWCA
ncbi:hypothetical protein PtB15_10B394 [Puccinia triticina]|nr:hypothetical protein PtB15_10B394 [Puccinia triticina]